jgi:hypothetical protein
MGSEDDDRRQGASEAAIPDSDRDSGRFDAAGVFSLPRNFGRATGLINI